MLARILCLALFPAAPSLWDVGVDTSYVSSGESRGLGIGATALWAPARFFAFGATFDVARVSADGTAVNSLPFSYAIASTFVGGLIQVRLPVGPFLPYADLGVGLVAVSSLRSRNNQCWYRSGPGARLGIGLQVALGERFALGLRGSARSPGWALDCTAMYGPWTFEARPLYALGTTASYRW